MPQVVKTRGSYEWDWQVKADEVGKSTLYLSVYTEVLLNGIHAKDLEKTYRRDVVIREDYSKLTGELITHNLVEIVKFAGPYVLVFGTMYLSRRELRRRFSSLVSWSRTFWSKRKTEKTDGFRLVPEQESETPATDDGASPESAAPPGPPGPTNAREPTRE